MPVQKYVLVLVFINMLFIREKYYKKGLNINNYLNT